MWHSDDPFEMMFLLKPVRKYSDVTKKNNSQVETQTVSQ